MRNNLTSSFRNDMALINRAIFCCLTIIVLMLAVYCLAVKPLSLAKERDNDLTKDFPDRVEYVGIAVEENEYFVWGSSPVIGKNDKVHLFVARWPAGPHKGGGWARVCEIARYVSDSPEGPFKFAEVVVNGEGKQLSPHNPSVRFIDGKYVLTYIANDGVKGMPSNQKIYMQIADSPEGPWRKMGDDGLVLGGPTNKTIWCYKSTVGFNNPSIYKHSDGTYRLHFKASHRDTTERRFGVAISDNLEGPYRYHPTQTTDIPDKKGKHVTIEDGYAFEYKSKHYIICRTKLNAELIKGYGGILWVSDDGLTYKAHPGYYAQDKAFPAKVKEKAKNIWRKGQLERPQLLIIDGKPAYLYLCGGVNLSGKKNSTSFVFRIKKSEKMEEK